MQCIIEPYKWTQVVQSRSVSRYHKWAWGRERKFNDYPRAILNQAVVDQETEPSRLKYPEMTMSVLAAEWNGQESLAASIDHILEQQAVQAQTYLAQASEETYKRNLDLSEEADFSESTDEWQETFWQDELDNDSIPDSDLEEQEDEMDFEFSDNESNSSDGTETRAVTAAMTS
ncbi:hypothetical protein BDP27DRAFT_1370147 [Rhodocollybia butyracea]|uniref:Uncharacterized protein n=1 Tax=Rhodocollybia butyracea TaxID=206335 RepID=A0A9P5PCE4_9AGAR|nr:hypothetical protein BDP27DRAFT_1370147 [Rhodocollybia butyracea]